MLTGFPRTRWLRRWFSESYAVRISMKISRICEFRVIMGIMTGLLGCCLSSTRGSRANDACSPCSLGCWTNNTLAARSLSPKSNAVRCIDKPMRTPVNQWLRLLIDQLALYLIYIMGIPSEICRTSILAIFVRFIMIMYILLSFGNPVMN